jgi:alpha-L-arabinofuranosidase
MKTAVASLCLLVPFTFALAGEAVDPIRVQVSVDLDAKGLEVAPTMHGLFYEDINYAADGGIYAELVQNRSFEHRNPLYAWSEVARGGSSGRVETAKENPLNDRNRTYLRLTIEQPGNGFGAANGGFTGVPVRKGETYRLSLYTRSASPDFHLLACIEGSDGVELARTRLASPGREWTRQEVDLRPSVTDPEARLVILAHGIGQVDFDMVSLFPHETFQQRPNGLRRDLAEALAEMAPRFLRFPGGCIAEGHGLHNAYRWKNTVGDVATRQQDFNLWRGPAFPEYHQTFGLGFFEYFQLAADLGAEPVPVVNCGMACQARRGVHAPLDELDEWIQDALDLIEFANGPVDSTWGSVRAAMGRAEPFNLRYLTIGNEQWNQEYFDRYAPFQQILRERHPEIQLISTSGPLVDDPLWTFAWNKFNSGEADADLVDEHYYVSPQWLLANSDRYERYDRNAPKVQVGEFAAHEPNRRSTLRAALAEASYMTGLLRNADVVRMIAYAPLFARRGHSQWEPNLIWFDNSGVLLTPSYHIQAIYGRNRPDRVLPTVLDVESLPAPSVGGRIGLGTWNTKAEYRDIRVTAPDGRVLYASDFAAGADEWELVRGQWSVENGSLRQMQQTSDRIAYAGDPQWGDYTLSLKARKIEGSEGFMVHFGAGSMGMGHWNLGGWNNSQHGLSVPGLAVQQRRGSIETDRWYDVRIELRGSEIAAYLDGELLQQASLKDVRRKALYTVVGRDDAANELIVYLANPSAYPVTASVNLQGAGRIGSEARMIRLAGDPDDVNTFENPGMIVPEESNVPIGGPSFENTLPPYSFSLLRIPHEKR